jgi:hypothetical protein
MSGMSGDLDIDPIGDQRHTLSAVRADVTEELLGAGASGSVGTSLDRSSVWFRRARNWTDFLRTIDLLLDAFDNVVQTGGGHDRFVVFAKKSLDFNSIEAAYELTFEIPTPLGELPTDPDTLDAYEWLSSATVGVEPAGSAGLRFTVVDEDGLSATIHLVPRAAQRGTRIELDGFGKSSGDDRLYERARDALGRVSPVIYYGSGHTVTSSGVVQEHFADVSFGGWDFDAFEGATLSKEKPEKLSASTLLDTVGLLDSANDDDSLFGWAIRRWSAGWLYCDDRSDELFDFVHFDPGAGSVRVIHIKSAGRTKHRRIAAQPFEEVCAQLQKNLVSLSRVRLVDELESRSKTHKAGPLWHDGLRSPDMDKFVATLREPRPREAYLAVIVQPHVSDRMLAEARASSSGPSTGTIGKLRRLEHLLVATDNVASRVAARLEVIAYAESAQDNGSQRLDRDT